MTSITETRGGISYWLRGYAAMMRYDVANLRMMIPFFLVIQVLMGAGMAVIYGFYFDQMPVAAATFITTGAPVLAIVPVGMALVPGLVMQSKFDQTYDFLWSLPVPRAAIALSNFTLFTALAIPGTAAALAVALWRYGIDLQVSPAVVPAVLLTALMAVSVGFAFAHAIPEPRVTNLIVNLIIFAVLLFSPIAFPIENYPDWFRAAHRVLPFFHMANVVRAGLTEGLAEGVAQSYLVLGAWTAGSWLLSGWVVGRRS